MPHTRLAFQPFSEVRPLRKLPRSTNSFGITSFADPHPLTPIESYRFKNPGEGQAQVTLSSSTATAALSFHTLTNCNFRKPFVLIFMQIDGGVGGYLCLSSTKIILYPLATLNFQSNIPSGSGLSAFNFRSVVDRVFSSLLPYLIASSFRGLSS